MKASDKDRQIVIHEYAKEPLKIFEKGKESSVNLRISKGVRAVVFDTSTSEHHRLHAHLEAGSDLHFISLSTGSARAYSSELETGASIHWHLFTIGDAPKPHSLHSILQGEGATSDINWVFCLRENQKQSIDVRNIFNAPRGGGEITMKGIAEGRSFATCHGMIEIGEAGQGTATYLTQDVLMLDPTAKIDAVPALEIRTNDVKASHSATISRVTVEDLFYFQSRGIPPLEARKMYTEGFTTDLTERIPDQVIRKEIREALTH